MNYQIFRSNSRGTAHHGWLRSHFSFSFADYYNPDRVHFGKLRVLNDDIIAPGAEFDTHPHNNMEIISIPLVGSLAHHDSEGHTQTIGPGEIQVMSAGSGIYHSEYNASRHEDANFLQIWIVPGSRNVKPRYDQKFFEPELLKDRFYTVVSGRKDAGHLWIQQDASLALASVVDAKKIELPDVGAGYGLHLFVIEGRVVIGEETLEKRDAIEITGPFEGAVYAGASTQLLAITVPMT